MSNLLNGEYYIDIDAIVEKCKTDSSSKDEDGQEIIEINIFKYEMIKMLIDRVINEIDDYEEEELDIFRKDKVGTPSFRLAFNTLIKNDIIIEENE
jgi:hypothetical protein